MSICKICASNGKPGVEITWSEKIKNAHTGKLIPLETDGSTFHKHYEPTNGNPTPVKTETNTAAAKWVRSITSSPTPIKTDPKVDLNNLNVIKVIAAALQEYIAIKEGQ